MTYVRSDQAQIVVELTGSNKSALNPAIYWSSLEGGDNVPEVAVAFPGGMAPLVPLGGFPKPTPLTVSRPWEEALIAPYKVLWEVAGRESVQVSYQILNANREPYGPKVTYTGILGTVTRPNYKAGTSEEAKLTITVELNGAIS